MTDTLQAAGPTATSISGSGWDLYLISSYVHNANRACSGHQLSAHHPGYEHRVFRHRHAHQQHDGRRRRRNESHERQRRRFHHSPDPRSHHRQVAYRNDGARRDGYLHFGRFQRGRSPDGGNRYGHRSIAHGAHGNRDQRRLNLDLYAVAPRVFDNNSAGASARRRIRRLR